MTLISEDDGAEIQDEDYFESLLKNTLSISNRSTKNSSVSRRGKMKTRKISSLSRGLSKVKKMLGCSEWKKILAHDYKKTFFLFS